MRELHYGKYTVRDEDLDDAFPGTRYNPGQVLEYRSKHGKHKVLLDAGSYDDVTVFREGQFTVVLSENTSLDYIGIQVFDDTEEKGNEHDERMDLFLQGDESASELLGRKWEDKSSMWKVKVLFNHVSEAAA